MKKEFYLTKKLPPYIFAEIHRLKLTAISEGMKVLDFGMGNPDSAPPEHVINDLSSLSRDKSLYGYSTVGGIKILKESICSYYKRRFGVDLDYKSECLVTIGAKEGISSIATAISDSKSYICVPSPSYPIHTFAFQISKANTISIECKSSKEFLAKFKNQVENGGKKITAVIVNYPCNPTTEIVGLDFYKELVKYCKKKEIYIISDIAYAELYFDEKDKPHSILEVEGARDIAIEFYSVSKSYSMAGCRIGFALGNKNLISALYKIKSYLDYGSFTPLQLVAAEALTEKSSLYLDNLRKLYKERSIYLVRALKKELNWEVEPSKASMFLWAKIPTKFYHMNSFDFCKMLIEKCGVALSAGSSFGKNGEGYVRFSLIHDKEQMDEALIRMKILFNS